MFTDNNPLTYVLTSARLNATGLRWVGELADFSFTIKYRPGRANADADTLSRAPLAFDNMAEYSEEISPSTIHAVNQGVKAEQYHETTWIGAMTASVSDEMGSDDQPELDQLRKKDIKQAQEKDPAISYVLNALHNGRTIHQTPEFDHPSSSHFTPRQSVPLINPYHMPYQPPPGSPYANVPANFSPNPHHQVFQPPGANADGWAPQMNPWPFAMGPQYTPRPGRQQWPPNNERPQMWPPTNDGLGAWPPFNAGREVFAQN